MALEARRQQVAAGPVRVAMHQRRRAERVHRCDGGGGVDVDAGVAVEGAALRALLPKRAGDVQAVLQGPGQELLFQAACRTCERKAW